MIYHNFSGFLRLLLVMECRNNFHLQSSILTNKLYLLQHCYAIYGFVVHYTCLIMAAYYHKAMHSWTLRALNLHVIDIKTFGTRPYRIF